MNLTINREVLLSNLNTVSRGLPSKTPLPILTGIKLYATETDLFMTSSNSDISVEVDITDASLIITEPGQTVVPGKFFIDIIRKINSKTINLYLSDDKILVIRADRGEYKLHIMDPLDYPQIDLISLENPLTLDANKFSNIIKETVFAASSQEKKPILTGVNFKNENGDLIATATDSFRLAQKKISIPEYNDFNITVPSKSLEELTKVIDNDIEIINLYLSNNKLLFQFKNVCFQTRLLDGNYPDTSRLIPREFSNVLKFNKDELIDAVERVSLLSPRDKEKEKELTYSIIKLAINTDRIIEISTTNASVGDAKEELIPTGLDVTSQLIIGFSARYLIEALRSFISTEISINFSGEIRPFIIRGEKDEKLTQLILPVRMD